MSYSIDLGMIGDLMLAARNSETSQFYLDTQTGQAHVLSEQLLNAVLRRDESLLQSLPEDEREDEPIAQQILFDDEDRFVPIAEIKPESEFQWMTDFKEFISTPGLYEKLSAILDVSKAMKGFEDTLTKHPAERELWIYHFQQKRREEAEAWLEEIGIEEGETFSFERSANTPLQHC